jgi:hypothetical protein
MSLIHRASGSGVACRDFARQFAGITIASMVEAYLLWTVGKRHEDEESRRRMLEAQRQKTLTYRPPLISPQLPTTTELVGAVKSLRLILPRHLSHGWPIEPCCVAPGDVFEKERQARRKAPEAAKSERSLLALRQQTKALLSRSQRKWRRLLCELTYTSRYI